LAIDVADLTHRLHISSHGASLVVDDVRDFCWG
jgi:hypothetical protein